MYCYENYLNSLRTGSVDYYAYVHSCITVCMFVLMYWSIVFYTYIFLFHSSLPCLFFLCRLEQQYCYIYFNQLLLSHHCSVIRGLPTTPSLLTWNWSVRSMLNMKGILLCDVIEQQYHTVGNLQSLEIKFQRRATESEEQHWTIFSEN